MALPRKFEIDFDHRGRVKTFERTASSEELAVFDAKAGFQWRYGYWPEDPIDVRSTEVRDNDD